MRKTYLALIVFIILLLTIHSTHAEEPGMVLIPAGELNNGKSMKASHVKNYYIDKTEVTQKDFKKIMGHTNFFLKEQITQQSRSIGTKPTSIAKR